MRREIRSSIWKETPRIVIRLTSPELRNQVLMRNSNAPRITTTRICRTYHAQPTIERAAQATIDAQFKRAKNYYDSYLNICRAVFNILDDNIDDAFKVSNHPMLVGWNPSMEPREMFDQITATYGKSTPAALMQNDMLSEAFILRTTPPKYCSGALTIVRKYRS